jgi:transcriptional regulator with XRE-family HTH domain
MGMDLQVAVGGRIRERRKASGLSQEEFARRAGIERSFFARIERGTQNVSLDTLGRIALALQVDLGDLLDGLPPGAGDGGS